jgi:chromosome partitioning protein
VPESYHEIMIYAVSGVKGGISKSTTALFLGEALSREGRKVLVVDADPQGTILEWEASAEASGAPLSVTVEGLPSAVLLRRRLPALAEGYDDVIIDCPNRDVGIIEAAISASSLVIVPCPPGVEELRRARSALRLAEQASTRARLLITLVDTRTKLTRELLEVIDADDTLSRFDTLIRRRAGIAETVGATRPRPNDLHDYAALATEIMKEETK